MEHLFIQLMVVGDSGILSW